MRNLILFLAFAIIAFNATFSQTEIEASSKIKSVQLFIQGAQIERTATVKLPAGKSLIKIPDLSSLMDPNTFQVKLEDAKLISINHKINYLKDKPEDTALDTLVDRIESLSDSINYKKTFIKVIDEEIAFLKANQELVKNKENVSLEDLSSIYSFYGNEYRQKRISKIQLEQEIAELEILQNKYQKQLRLSATDVKSQFSEMMIMIETEQAITLDLDFAYLVSGAGWFPNYDIKAINIEQPIQLFYKAKIFQNTGEDWDNIQLSLSNAEPFLSNSKPTLETYTLSSYQNSRPYASTFKAKEGNFVSKGTFDPVTRKITGTIIDGEYNEGLIGASVLVKGASVGTVTDLDGNFELILPEGAESFVISYVGYESVSIPVEAAQYEIKMEADVMKLDEIVVVGYGSITGVTGRPSGPTVEKEDRYIPVQQRINQTNVFFEIEDPFTIKSGKENYTIDLAQYEIPAYYEYQCIPKLETIPFLIAKVTDWEQYNLLEGEANLFFESTYIGRSVLDVRLVKDTLEFSLGKDKSIFVERIKEKDAMRKNNISNNQFETRAFTLKVLNTKQESINMLLIDQIPVSRQKNIEVQKVEVDGGRLIENTGKVSWKLSIPSGGQVQKKLAYTVKFDKDYNLKIE
ncbi:MAG: DUF4139 domain-containing protein [Bacteroidota bacterium]